MSTRAFVLDDVLGGPSDFLDRLFGRDLSSSAWSVDPCLPAFSPALPEILQWADFVSLEPANDLEGEELDEQDEDEGVGDDDDGVAEAFDEEMFWAVMASSRRRR